MSRRYTIPFVLALSTLLPCLSIPAELDEDPRTQVALESVRILERLDIDRDGQLATWEVPSAARDFVKRVVEDAGFVAGQPIPVGDLRDRIRARLSSDARDFQNVAQTNALVTVRSQLYNRYDENSDGVVDVFEFDSVSEADRHLFNRVSRRELLQSSALLRHLDMNSDGIIQSVELGTVFQPYLERLKRQHNLRLEKQPRLQNLRTQIKKILGTEDSPFDEFASRPRNHADESKYERQTRQRMYATNLIAIYDDNEDGVLEAEEWRNLATMWQQYDRNHDRRLSQQEVADGLQKISLATGAPSSNGTTTSRHDQGTLRRLPDGLPEWFVVKDFAGNADGQVQMVEFADVWNDEQLSFFQDLDANNDGVIESNECLRKHDGDSK